MFVASLHCEQSGNQLMTNVFTAMNMVISIHITAQKASKDHANLPLEMYSVTL